MARMTSLRKDNNDNNAVNWGRFKHYGACVASEFYQPVPYFFTREGSQLNLVGQYRGASAFLIGSGPSFKNVDKSLLRKPGVWTISTNNSIRSFRGNACIMVDDPSRFTASMWLDPTVTKFVPTGAFEKPLWDNRLIIKGDNEDQRWEPLEGKKVGDCPNVIGYRRNEKFMAERFLYEDTINWGNHTDEGGGRSVFLAALRVLFLLGFRRVYLLGVDFKMDEGHKYHFDEERTKGAINGNNSTYKKMKEWTKELQPRFLAEKYLVYNCNPDSALTAFPFKSVEEAVAEASFTKIGDAERERVKGMYCTYEDKVNAWNAGIEPPPDSPEKSTPVKEDKPVKSQSAMDESRKSTPSLQTFSNKSGVVGRITPGGKTIIINPGQSPKEIKLNGANIRVSTTKPGPVITPANKG